MRIAIVGSRVAPADMVARVLAHLPRGASEIVSGGADGVDAAAAEVARRLDLPLREFLPDYAAYGRSAPLRRNEQIIAYADEVLAFWNKTSAGTRHVIATCIQVGKPVHVIPLPVDGGDAP
ncbi:MAG: hypothetical protein ACOYJY_08220 [Acutalibacteraceae bacterium]|jgi:predicted Rossmann fold nucleotide-binding protein DprA/Smf involved in DNA uptake